METDYVKLGLKVGIEIHQQLATSTKLFCGCPPELFKEQPDGTTKVSVRTTAPYDASAVCRQFNGGGHVRAAGATLVFTYQGQRLKENVEELAGSFGSPRGSINSSDRPVPSASAGHRPPSLYSTEVSV